MNLVVIATLLNLFTTSNTWAQAAGGAGGEGSTGFLLQLPIFAAIFGLLYFTMIRPQKNQQKKHGEFLAKLERGEEVVTASGIIGKIVGMSDRVITLEISQGTEVKMLRSQVSGYLKDSVQTSQK